MGISGKIYAVMTGKKEAGLLLSLLLGFFELLYGLVVNCRKIFYDRKMLPVKALPCRVISIGNLTVGGTGKTPMTIYLARLLTELGYKTAVISRGYKSRAEHGSAIVSDGKNILAGPDIVGDEPYMMAQNLKGIPVLVGADRFQVGMKAVEKFSPDVIVLDDAFQHRRLKRDLDIVLIDDKSFLGNRHLLPRGILREPVRGLTRADLFVLTRCKDNTSDSFGLLTDMAPEKSVFRSAHEAYGCGIYRWNNTGVVEKAGGDKAENIDYLKNARVFIFSGIAKNEEFLDTVTAFSGAVAGSLTFGDHHGYTEPDLYKIIQNAKACEADFIVTTEKDYVKIDGKLNSPIDVVVIGIRLSFGSEEKEFTHYIREKVTQNRS